MKRIIPSMALLVLVMLSCQKNSSSSGDTLTKEQETVLADSISVEIDYAIKELKDQTESIAEEVDQLLEGI